MVLLVIIALGPAKWTPRTALGWEIDHFLGYFAITSLFCHAWPRPLVIGGALMAVAALLEGLQALTPDRSSYFVAAFYGEVGRWRRLCLLRFSSAYGSRVPDRKATKIHR
jgi:hypothetical protein